MAMTPEEKRARDRERSRRWYEANKERTLAEQRQRRIALADVTRRFAGKAMQGELFALHEVREA